MGGLLSGNFSLLNKIKFTRKGGKNREKMGRRVGEDNYHVDHDRRTTKWMEGAGGPSGMFEHCVGYSQLHG